MYNLEHCSYGAKTSTMTQADRERPSAFEMWLRKRMDKICWGDKVKNDEMLQKERGASWTQMDGARPAT